MKKITQILLLFMAGLVVCSCAKEQIGSSQDEYTVELKVSVPQIGAKSRAMTTTAEDNINTIDVLAFVKDAGGRFRYTYTAQFVSKNILGDQMTVTVKAKSYDVDQQFVLLVNASSELSAAGINHNEVLADAMKKLVCTTGGGEWPLAGADIPMYAKTTPQLVTPSTGVIGNYPLIRMVAKVDIKL